MTGRCSTGAGGICLYGSNNVTAPPPWPRSARDPAQRTPAAWSRWTRRAATSPRCTPAGRPPSVPRRSARPPTGLTSRRPPGRQRAAAGRRARPRPDVDVNSAPDNPVIGARSFGVDPSRSPPTPPPGRGPPVHRGRRVRQALPRPRRHRHRQPPRLAAHRRRRARGPRAGALPRRGPGRRRCHDLAHRRAAIDPDRPATLPARPRHAARGARLRRRGRQRRARHGRGVRRARHPGGGRAWPSPPGATSSASAPTSPPRWCWRSATRSSLPSRTVV